METVDSLPTGGQDRVPIVISYNFFYLKHTDRKKAKWRKQNHALMLRRKCKMLEGVRKQPVISPMSILQEYAPLFPLLTANPGDTRW